MKLNNQHEQVYLVTLLSLQNAQGGYLELSVLCSLEFPTSPDGPGSRLGEGSNGSVWKGAPLECLRFPLTDWMGNVFLCPYELLTVEQPEGTVDGCCGELMTKEKDHEETVRKKNQDHPGTRKSLCQFLKPCFLILHRIKLMGMTSP